MKIEVNVDKRYFLVLLGVILLLGLVIYVNAVAVDTKVFHGVDQVDWEQTIPGSIKIQGLVAVGGQAALSADSNSISVGDLSGGDGKRNLILRSADQEAMVIDQFGKVGIGLSSPTTNLDVKGNIHSSGYMQAAGYIDASGNIFSNGKIFNDNSCRQIFGHSKGGTQKGKISVPTECIDNVCLIAIVEGPRISFVHYREGVYDFGGFNVHAWISSSAGKSNNMYSAQSQEAGLNGDAASDIILSGITLDSGRYQIYLYDDGTGSGQETGPSEWSWKSEDTGFALYVCN